MKNRTLNVHPPMNTFWEVNLTNLPRSLEAAFSVWLFNQGCWGTQERLSFTQTSLKYGPRVKHRRFIDLTAYFDPRAKEEMEGKIYRWLAIRAPVTKASWKLQLNQDWLKEWKKYFKPFDLVGLKFVPAWEVTKLMARSKTVIVDPGMAFGTGQHATTKFAIELIKVLSDRGKLKGKTVLDVGAGSGILSVVAERLGAKSVTALDNDPEAWRECRKMFKLNKTKGCKVTEKQLPLGKKHDVVMANIIDGVLIDLRRHLWSGLKPGGHLILSGILTDGAKAFIKSFLAGTKGKVIAELSDEEWTGLLISK